MVPGTAAIACNSWLAPSACLPTYFAGIFCFPATRHGQVKAIWQECLYDKLFKYGQQIQVNISIALKTRS